MHKSLKISASIFLVLATLGCNEKDSAKPASSDKVIKQSEYERGPAEMNTSIAARLAEEFMVKQPDAARYSKRASGVLQEEIGVFIVRFELLDGSPDNAALVNVVLSEKRCERLRVK